MQESAGPNARVVVGVSVPTRAFAAPLVAVGAAAAAFEDHGSSDLESHFAQLSALPAGTLLTWLEGRYLRCGPLRGTDIINGEAYIRMGDGYGRRWDMTHEVHPLGEEDEEFDRRRLNIETKFVEGALKANSFVHALRSEAACLIVGVKSVLEAELTSERLACGSPGDRATVTGTFQDLLRCRDITPACRTHFAAEILPAYASDLPTRLRAASPTVVVADGAAAFLRWRARFSAPLIAVLDRASRPSEDAAFAFAADRARSTRDANFGMQSVPAGVELAGYEEELR
jgi:hypothetical protein